MKNISLIFMGLIVLLVFSNSCKKTTSSATPNNFQYQTVGRVLINPGADTLGNFIFQVYNEGNQLRTRIRNTVNSGMMGDGGQQLLKDPVNGDILFLKEGDVISGDAIWKDTITSNSFSLERFQGKGTGFIGFRDFYFPGGVTFYYYGWIQVINNPGNDTLIIVDMAVNQTKNSPLRAGQKN
jgi:hypothetical protein